jgi:CheY-like chemotaxis protein
MFIASWSHECVMSVKVVHPGRSSLQVLHVDDDPLNLRVVRDILSAFGHVGHQASTGAEALEQLGSRIFDVVLLDILMPGMSGLEVVSRLRASLGPERRTPVIALTADTLTRTRQDYLRLGFQDLVTKPILVSRLLQSLTRVTREFRAAEAERRLT